MKTTLLKSVQPAVAIRILSCNQTSIVYLWTDRCSLFRFLLRFNGSSKQMQFSNRNKLFLPVNQGWLGIHPLELVNKSLVAKQVWCIIFVDQSSILAITMGKNYIYWSKEQWLKQPYNSSIGYGKIFLNVVPSSQIILNGKLAIICPSLSTTSCGGPCKALLKKTIKFK